MKYKYKVGDKLKIVNSGDGFAPSAIGRIITVEELGAYTIGYAIPGYKPKEKFDSD